MISLDTILSKNNLETFRPYNLQLLQKCKRKKERETLFCILLYPKNRTFELNNCTTFSPSSFFSTSYNNCKIVQFSSKIYLKQYKHYRKWKRRKKGKKRIKTLQLPRITLYSKNIFKLNCTTFFPSSFFPLPTIVGTIQFKSFFG